MYEPSGSLRPANVRGMSSLPPENPTWHMEPSNGDSRTGRTDPDRIDAGKRHWNGERSSIITSFQGVISQASSLSGSCFVPRTIPRFQGHCSGFFAETQRNEPSFSAAGLVDIGLVRRPHRNPNPSTTSPASKSQDLGGSVGVDHGGSEGRHNRDQFLPYGDEKEGRDRTLPPHLPRIHSDSLLLRNGEKTLQRGRRHWELSPKIDRDNLTRPHGNADLYSDDRRHSNITGSNSEKDCGFCDRRFEVGRFERYGNGSRDGPRADYEGSKDTCFSCGWGRERGHLGVTAKHSSITAGIRNTREIGVKEFLAAGSAQNSLHVSMLSSTQDFDQPSPSKRPRLGWGQGLAKYENKVDGSVLVQKSHVETDGQDITHPTLEVVEKMRGAALEKLVVPGWEDECNQRHSDSFIDTHWRQGVNMMKPTVVQDGSREVSDKGNLYALLEYSSRRGENKRKPALCQESRGKEKCGSYVEVEDKEKNMSGIREEKKGAGLCDKELEVRCQYSALSLLAKDHESRGIDNGRASGVLQEFLKENDLNLKPSVLVKEAKSGEREVAKGSPLIEIFEDVVGGSRQESSLAELLNNAKHDPSISDTLRNAEIKRDISLSPAFVTVCGTGLRGTEASFPFLPQPHLEMIAEDTDVVSLIEPTFVRSSNGYENRKSPLAHVVDEFVAAPGPLLLTESVVFPAPSTNHVSARRFSSDRQCSVQDVSVKSIDRRPLIGGEVLEEPGLSTFVEMDIAPQEILVEDPIAPQLLAREDKTGSCILEPVRAVLRTELTTAQVAASSDPFMSQVREQVFATTKSDTTLPESEPASDGSLIPEISTVYTCVSEDLNDVDHAVRLDSASQTEKAILDTVDTVEAEIDSVKKEIAQISLDLSGYVCLEVVGSFHAGVLALDSPSKVAGGDDISVFMEENSRELPPFSVGTGVVCPSSCLSSHAADYTRSEKSPTCSERYFSSTPDFLLRESSMQEKGVLELVPGLVELKSASFDKSCDNEIFRGARSESISRSLGVVEADYAQNQCCNEVATGGSLLRERNQTMIECLMRENKEKARLSGIAFVHLLPQSLSGTIDRQLYHSPIEAPVWQHNVETHMNIHSRLMEKLVERRHFMKFKERVLTLRYRALKEAWQQDQMGLSARRNRLISLDRWDGEGISSNVYPSQRSLRFRPLSLDRVPAASDAAQAVKTLIKNPQVGALRSVLKMPAMILDGKERAIHRFVSRNALVEDPIAVEMERKAINLWTSEERKIFAEKFAVHDKNFKEIASYLQFKTIADCVEYYYQNQKSESFGKSQYGKQLKNRWEYTKTRCAYLTPTAARRKRNYEENCARIEALNVANMNMKLSQINGVSRVSERANFFSDSLRMPLEMRKCPQNECKPLEVTLPLPEALETAASSLISTSCRLSSTAAHLIDQCKVDISAIERKTRRSTTRSLEQNAGGLKGALSTHLRHMSSRTAALEHSQWTDAERELFMSAVAAYGKDFGLIASLVSTKSESQCKAFFSKTRKRLCLDDLVEQFQANQAAALLVQSFRHDAGLEAKRISTFEMKASAISIAEELIDTAAAVSTLESLKEQSKCFSVDTSDLALVADAAAVLEKITLVKPEVASLDMFFSDKSRPSNQELACELSKDNRLNFAVPSTLLRKEDDEDSEATKSDGSYQIGVETETDIIVDQAAAALIGMSEMLANRPGSEREKSEATFDMKRFPIGFTSRLQSTRSSQLHPVTEANSSLTFGRTGRRAKERENTAIPCKTITRDRPQGIFDVPSGRKWREIAVGEPKPRREPTSWTREEKERFAVILQEHGKDWPLLHESLPLKSLTQIKTYFHNSKARSRLPASGKLLTVVRNDGADRKRKADEIESTRKASEVVLRVKRKVRGNVAPADLKRAMQKESTLPGSALVSGTAGSGVDSFIPSRSFSGQSANRDSSSMNGMRHLVRQMVSANTYSQLFRKTLPGSTQDGHRVPTLPRSALPFSVVSPHTPRRIQPLLAVSARSEAVGPDFQARPPVGVAQAGSPGAIHQVAQQVQQMLQQYKHLQNQLNLLIQQQAALPPQLLPRHQHVTQQTLQAVRPLEEKLYQVVQKLHQQYELQGRVAAPCEGEGHWHRGDFQQQQVKRARGILKVKPIGGVLSQPLEDPATSPSSGVLFNEAVSGSEDTNLQQDHYLTLGIGVIPIVTTGSTAGAQENQHKPVELQVGDSDTDCEGMVTEDSHLLMSRGHSSYSVQQQNTTQSTTSTLSSDSEQLKSWDVKLFGQSLLSKPPPLSSSLPRSAGSSTQEFLVPNASASNSTGTSSKGCRTFESLPSAFESVGTASITAERQHQPTAWPGKSGVRSITGDFQLSGRTELSRKEVNPNTVKETPTSLAAQSNGEIMVLALEQTSQGDDEHCNRENLSSGQFGNRYWN